MVQEWSYFKCNTCYVMFPHLATPEVCVCGNNLQSNSTRVNFVASWNVKELLDAIRDDIICMKNLDQNNNKIVNRLLERFDNHADDAFCTTNESEEKND